MRLRVLVLAVLLAGCGSEVTPAATTTSAPATTAPATTTTSAAAATQAPTTKAVKNERCEEATPALVAAISQGLKGATSIRFAAAVKSNEFAKVYMVAADLEGSALEGKRDHAVWATNDLAGGGLIFSADEMAGQFSSWGSGAKTDAEIRSSSDGVKQAKECSAALAS